MFGYSIELEKKFNIGRNTQKNGSIENEGFKTSIKGFKTKEEAQQALEEAENEAIASNEYQIVGSRVYEY